MTDAYRLAVDNHLKRDSRLDFWSVNGIGPYSHATEDWVGLMLSINLDTTLPAALLKIFERAQACMVYGCYHYPLFTLGIEELFRFDESALRAAISEMDTPKPVLKKTYAKLINWAEDEGIFNSETSGRWHAGRDLRNSTTHKSDTMLFSPNDALWQLTTTKELAESLFETCRLRV